MRATIVIPTYNEAENLPKLVSALFSLPLELRVLVVDDNSPDGTGRIAEELARTHPGRVDVLHRPGKMGLRSAYLNGFQKILDGDAQAIVQMDADFSHDPAKLVEMARLLESSDIVLGSRYVQGGSVDEKWPIWRKWLSAFGNFYARSILGLPLHDVTTGYRMWRTEALKQMPFERIQSSGYIFLVEMIYLAHCLEFKIGEVPIYFADRRFGKSKMSLKIQIEAAVRIWQVLWNYRDLRKAGRLARL
ncbi:MAG TPA: polyprenol monophosphomannose synthase [Anaerolineales bacterium]|nr:polyprenol monophosphomannose synthase [Anaerolineales bacterium]HRK91429.1 polyprenol monophosphomannose synthase [Anaerolineales bacterium]